MQGFLQLLPNVVGSDLPTDKSVPILGDHLLLVTILFYHLLRRDVK